MFASSNHSQSDLFSKGAIIYVNLSLGRHPFIRSFYSLVAKLPDARALLTVDDAHMIKGLARASLCYLLRKKSKLLPLKRIKIEASGSSGSKSMLGLVRYYQELGFVPSNKHVPLQKQIEDQYVPMVARIGDVIQTCRASVSLTRIHNMPDK